MIPTGGTVKDATVQTVLQPSKTYKLDLDKGRIAGMTDNLDAMKQAVFKILQTERFRYLIYSFDYGNEMGGLMGVSPLFMQSEVNRYLNEALLQDDRIQSIQDVQVTPDGDSALVQFTVVSIYGTFEREVNVNV